MSSTIIHSLPHHLPRSRVGAREAENFNFPVRSQSGIIFITLVPLMWSDNFTIPICWVVKHVGRGLDWCGGWLISALSMRFSCGKSADRMRLTSCFVNSWCEVYSMECCNPANCRQDPQQQQHRYLAIAVWFTISNSLLTIEIAFTARVGTRNAPEQSTCVTGAACRCVLVIVFCVITSYCSLVYNWFDLIRSMAGKDIYGRRGSGHYSGPWSLKG